MYNSTDERLKDEIKSFKGEWKGGYCEGDIFDYYSYSGYGLQSYVSILHVIYLMTIKPYINKDTNVIEIGPGRGTFTKGMVEANSVTCLDALSAEYNHFWEYTGVKNNINYIQVSDFSCTNLKDNAYNYLFSFGALCHVSFDGITQYAHNLYPKLQKGANCFFMVADYDKFNAAAEKTKAYNNVFQYLPFQKIQKINWWLFKKINKKKLNLKLNKDEDLIPAPGRWYHAGVDRTCAMLEKAGYKIISKDLGILNRDPIIHFIKES